MPRVMRGVVDRLLGEAAGLADSTDVPLDSDLVFDLEYVHRPGYEWATRAFCLVVSLLGLLVLSPLFLAIAIVGKITSPGPVFYRGARVGQHGREFTMFKFRTMEVGTEQNVGARLIREDEDPYTPFGKFLKRYKLDELPQLINVFLGQMNFVGPRPVRPALRDTYSKEVRNYERRFIMKPGITGLAQVRGGYYTNAKDKLRHEMIYMVRRSFAFDVTLIFLTFARVLSKMFTVGVLLAWIVLFVVLIPTDVQRSFQVGIGSGKVNLLYLAPLLAAVWLYVRRRLLSEHIVLVKTPVDLSMALFLLTMVIAVPFSYSTVTTIRGIGYYIATGIVIFYLVINSRISQTIHRITTTVLGLLAALVAVIACVEYVVVRLGTVPGDEIGRAEAMFGSPLVLAAFVSLMFPLALTKFLESPRPVVRLIWALAACLMLAAGYLSFSRIGLLSLLVATTIYLWRVKRSYIVVLLLVTVTALGSLYSTGDQRYRPARFAQSIVDATTAQTTTLRTLSLERLALGVGARSFIAYQSSRYGKQPAEVDERELPAEKRRRFDNMFLTILAENGVIGTIAFLLMLYTALKTIYRGSVHAKSERIRLLLWAIFCGMIGFMVNFLAFDTLRILSMGVLFWGALGLGVGIALHHGPWKLKHYEIVSYDGQAEPF